ncbi:MAG TPA: uridine kinase, partial [Patescibacteria group bacterium]|nr:uridine kinase [Patescibacteria group bacterium]
KNIIVEGIFVLSSQKLRKLADLTIYLEVTADERVRRRIYRDEQRGRNMLQTLEHSLVVEKMHAKHVAPMKKYATLVCPFGVGLEKKGITCYVRGQ